MGILTDSINDKWKDSIVELDSKSKREEVKLASCYGIEAIETLRFSRKYPIVLSTDENLGGILSCRYNKDLFLYYLFFYGTGIHDDNTDINDHLDLFEEYCNLNIEKLLNTKEKLVKEFSDDEFEATISMDVGMDGRITLYDKELSLEILDKVQPSAEDYNLAKQRFVSNRLKFKSQDKN